MTQNKKSIHDGHRKRLKARYKTNGPYNFQDHELLELLLHYSIAQKDTNPLGHALIERFGNLQGVFEATEEELTRVPGIGEHSAFLMKLIPALTQRYFEQIHNGTLQLNEPADRVKFFSTRFLGRKEECLFAAFLDENFKLIECALQFIGSVNAVEIHTAKIVQAALRAGAKNVVLAHNHFADNVPSDQDIRASRHLYLALQPFNIQLLDHVVVCGTQGISMQESGHFAKVIC